MVVTKMYGMMNFYAEFLNGILKMYSLQASMVGYEDELVYNSTCPDMVASYLTLRGVNVLWINVGMRGFCYELRL